MHVPYEPISKKGDSSSYVPQELAESQRQGITSIPRKTIANWDEIVAESLGLTKEGLFSAFSAEQIDSIGLAAMNFERGSGFVIADETGIGKGRILSGIVKLAAQKGKRVMFFTEREHLFSDFWRDLSDTGTVGDLRDPIVFHSTAKAYGQDGTVVLKGSAQTVKTIQSEGFPDSCNFVMTNYSQISLKQHKKNKKDAILDFIKGSILILDESHNAAGDSNMNKFLLSVIDAAESVVFSSATFIKDESQLSIYEKALGLDPETTALFKKLLKTDGSHGLRKALTYELTKKLQFWRREHEPIEIGWQTVEADLTIEQTSMLNSYSEIINGLFESMDSLSKEPSLADSDVAGGWYAIGGAVNRLSRNLILLFKIDALVDSVRECVDSGRKAVVVMDSTFASAIRKTIEFQDDSAEESTDDVEVCEISFKQLILMLMEDSVGKILKTHEGIPQRFFVDYESLKSKADAFGTLEISPIDSIVSKLSSFGISCGEISGRNFVIQGGKISKIKKRPKSALVSDFNSGLLDVMILTRSGAAGISLHASAAFKDQKPRDLYELEITNRPTYRLQFIGRVNRKNQVVKPGFKTVVTKLPFEQRVLNSEKSKLQKIQSHVSGDSEKHLQENVMDFFTEYCDKAAKAFLLENKRLAFRMGISLKGEKPDLYYVDSLLKRCMILNHSQQNALYDYLVHCSECESLLSSRENKPDKIDFSSVSTFWHQLDSAKRKSFTEAYGKLPILSLSQFKFPWVGLMKAESFYSFKHSYSLNVKKEMERNMASVQSISNHLLKTLSQLKSECLYATEFFKIRIEPLLKKINVGKGVVLISESGPIYGHVHEVRIPQVPNPHKFPGLCLIRIKTINPTSHSSIRYSGEDYWLTLTEAIENETFEIKNSLPNWKTYDRADGSYSRNDLYFVGHPVYVEFIRQAYRFGTPCVYEIAGRDVNCVRIPNSISEQSVKSAKRPICDPAEIMKKLISKEATKLSTVWEDESEVKPTLKIEAVPNGYILFVAAEEFRNPAVIDYPMRKRLVNRKGQIDGFETFFVPYKEIRMLLLMFEKRGAIWFMNNSKRP